MEHPCFLMGKSTISMAIFHSYVKLPVGKSPLNPIEPPFSYGFSIHPTRSNTRKMLASNLLCPSKVAGKPAMVAVRKATDACTVLYQSGAFLIQKY